MDAAGRASSTGAAGESLPYLDGRPVRLSGSSSLGRAVSGASQEGIDEAVADARLGEDVPRPRGVRLELPPQLRDVDVEVVRLRGIRTAPDLLENGLMREELSLVPGEKNEERVLVRRQLDRSAVERDGARLEIDAQVPDLEHRLTRRP